jgi:hypothetical protein
VHQKQLLAILAERAGAWEYNGRSERESKGTDAQLDVGSGASLVPVLRLVEPLFQFQPAEMST